MSEWARIESDGPVVIAPRSPASTSPAAVLAGRAKRQERLVLGSVDAGAHVLQREPRAVLVGSAIFLLPVLAINLVLSTMLFERYDSFDGAVVSLPELIGGTTRANGVETLLAYLGLVATSLAVALIGGYVTAVVLRYQFARPITLRAVFGDVLRRLPALAVGWLIGHIWVFGALALLVRTSGTRLGQWAVFIAPVSAAVLGAIVLISPVIVTERTGPWRSVRRALRLARSRFGACMALVLLAGALGSLLRFGITLMPRLAAATGLVTFGRFGWLVEGVAGQLAQLISVPLVALATAQFYLQLRMNAEGMDIALAAQSAFPPGRRWADG